MHANGSACPKLRFAEGFVDDASMSNATHVKCSDRPEQAILIPRNAFHCQRLQSGVQECLGRRLVGMTTSWQVVRRRI